MTVKEENKSWKKCHHFTLGENGDISFGIINQLQLINKIKIFFLNLDI